MFKDKHTLGVVDLAAYRKKIQQQAVAKPAEGGNHETEMATSILKIAAARIIAAEHATSGKVAKIQIQRLLYGARQIEQEIKKLLFSTGMVLQQGLEGAIQSAIPLLEAQHDRYKLAYPDFAAMEVGNYAEDFALYGYRSMKLTVHLTKDGDVESEGIIERLKLADKSAVIERCCSVIRAGNIPIGMLTLAEVYRGGENSDTYSRMSNYYAHGDFNIITRDAMGLMDELPAKEAALLAGALCDGFNGLLEAMPGLEQYAASIREMVGRFEMRHSILKTDVSKITLSEEDEKIAISGYKPTDEGYLEWVDYAQAKFGIDYYAAKRLGTLVESRETERIYSAWLTSDHKLAINTIASEVSKITDRWSIAIPIDAQPHRECVRLSNGNTEIVISLEPSSYVTWGGPYKLELSCSNRQVMIDNRINSDREEGLTIGPLDSFDIDRDLNTVLDKVASIVEKHDHGLNWAKLMAFTPAVVNEKELTYAQQVKADITKAIDEGILPAELKCTAAAPYYKSVRLTIAGLPDGCPVYTPEYIDHQANPNYKYHTDFVSGYMYSSAYCAMQKAMEHIVSSRIYCTDDGHGSCRGVEHNFSVGIGIKEALEKELLVDKDLAAKSVDWAFPPNAFNQPESVKVWDITFDPNKKLSLGVCKDIDRSVHGVMDDIGGMRSREIGDKYRLGSLSLCHALVAEAEKRLPVKMDSERNKEMREMIDSCKAAIAKKFKYCAEVRFRNDAQDTIKGLNLSNLAFTFNQTPKREFWLDIECGQQSQLNGIIHGLRVNVVTNALDAEGMSKPVVLLQQVVDPYKATTMLGTIEGALASQRIEPIIALYSMGVLNESGVLTLVKDQDYSSRVRDHHLLKKCMHLSADKKGLLCFVDSMMQKKQLNVGPGYVAKMHIANADSAAQLEVCVLPNRGFCVMNGEGKTTVYMDDVFHSGLDDLSFNRLKRETFPDSSLFVSSSVFVEDYVQSASKHRVNLTQQQRVWAASALYEWERNQPNPELYTLDGNVLGGAIVRKMFSSYCLITPDGQEIRLNEAQERKIKGLLANSAIQIRHEDYALVAENSLSPSA